MNDYEALAERLRSIEQRVEATIADTDEQDIIDVLEDIAGRLEGARTLAEERS